MPAPHSAAVRDENVHKVLRTVPAQAEAHQRVPPPLSPGWRDGTGGFLITANEEAHKLALAPPSLLLSPHLSFLIISSLQLLSLLPSFHYLVLFSDVSRSLGHVMFSPPI